MKPFPHIEFEKMRFFELFNEKAACKDLIDQSHPNYDELQAENHRIKEAYLAKLEKAYAHLDFETMDHSSPEALHYIKVASHRMGSMPMNKEEAWNEQSCHEDEAELIIKILKELKEEGLISDFREIPKEKASFYRFKNSTIELH